MDGCRRCGKALSGKQRLWCSENCRKRIWDHERSIATTCLDCGRNRISPGAKRCRDCELKRHEADHKRNQERIASLWSQGLSLKEIVADPEIHQSTVNSLGVEMRRMRREGRDLPYRYRMSQGGRGRRPPFKDAKTPQQARARLHYAIEMGRIKRPERCERCGDVTFVDGHHDDYMKPLDVEWLCKRCHMRLHYA